MLRGGDLAFSWRSAPQAQPMAIPMAVAAGLCAGFLHIPFVAAWLVVFPLAGMLYLIAREATPRLAARVAFFAWLGFWSVHLFWLPQSFSELFGAGSWVSGLAFWVLMPILWVIEAGFNTGMAWVAHRLTKTNLGMVFVHAMLLVLLEFIRHRMGALAFPWGNFGYTLIDTPLVHLAQFGGVYLLSIIIVLCAASVAAMALLEWRGLVVSAIIVIAGLVFGLTRPNLPTPTREALLVQGNIDPRAKVSGLSNALEVYSSLAKQATSNAVVVFPEAALNLYELTPLDFSPSNLPKIRRLIAGVADIRKGARLNSVAAIKSTVLQGTSTKAHLVPFGEFFPLRQALSFIYNPIFSIIGYGENYGGLELRYETRTLELDGERFGTYVCYDSVFPDVSRDRVLDGAQVLVNVSNDAWFGRTWGIEQHFMMGRMRAVETQRYVLRAGNTGITAVIDPYGRVLQRSPIQQRLALEAKYALQTGKTIYVQFGDWAVLLAAILAVIGMVLSRRENDTW